jgi:hypothetical protein
MRFWLFSSLQGGNWGPEKEDREQRPVIRMQFSTGLSVPRNKEKSIGFFVLWRTL